MRHGAQRFSRSKVQGPPFAKLLLDLGRTSGIQPFRRQDLLDGDMRVGSNAHRWQRSFQFHRVPLLGRFDPAGIDIEQFQAYPVEAQDLIAPEKTERDRSTAWLRGYRDKADASFKKLADNYLEEIEKLPDIESDEN